MSESLTHLKQYYIRFRHITPEMMFVPLYLISVDHIQVVSKPDATEYDLQCAVCQELANLNYNPDHIKIESSEREN